MYREPYIKPNAKYQHDIEKINKEIKEELNKENADKHRIMRLEEQKLIEALFSNEIGSSYAKYSSPW